MDIPLCLPGASAAPPDQVHCLAYLPWEAKYLELVPAGWRDFFLLALPHLHARSTDVHVAICLPFVRELIDAGLGPVDERVVYPAFILHDSGWSRMSQEEIAASLGVSGLALGGAAIAPKLRHAELGRELAEQLIDAHPLQPQFTSSQKAAIYQTILYHDRPDELRRLGSLPREAALVCDVDHLWSFTHPDFWQDTIRKGVAADEYLANLGRDLEGYFISSAAKAKARGMLEERGAEVQAWKDRIDFPEAG